MALTVHKICIVGCGPGSRGCITTEARAAVLDSEVLVGARRLLDLFPESKAEHITVRGEIAATIDAIELNRSRRVALLVTGDPGIASLAHGVLEHFGRDTCRVIPGISSVQVAFARLGVDWMDARIVSAHGATPEVSFEALRQERKIAVLAGSENAATWVAGLNEYLGANWRLFAAENLTLSAERVYECSAEALRSMKLPSLSVLVLIRSDCL